MNKVLLIIFMALVIMFYCIVWFVTWPWHQVPLKTYLEILLK